MHARSGAMIDRIPVPRILRPRAGRSRRAGIRIGRRGSGPSTAPACDENRHQPDHRAAADGCGRRLVALGPENAGGRQRGKRNPAGMFLPAAASRVASRLASRGSVCSISAIRRIRSAAPGSASSYPRRTSGGGRGPETRSSCRTSVVTSRAGPSARSGRTAPTLAGGRAFFLLGARARSRLTVDPPGGVVDVPSYPTPDLSETLLGRPGRDEACIAIRVRVQVHDAPRSAEEGLHSTAGHGCPPGTSAWTGGCGAAPPRLWRRCEEGTCPTAGNMAQTVGDRGKVRGIGGNAGATGALRVERRAAGRVTGIG